MDYDPSLLHEDDSRDFERIANIKDSVQLLISALKIERDPEIERTLLSIQPNHEPGEQAYVVPGFIARNLQPDTKVEQLWIDATVNRLTREGTIGIYISALSAAGDTVIGSVVFNKDLENKIETSFIVGDDDNDMPVFEPATMAEFNRYLASLSLSGSVSGMVKTGDYSSFDHMDLANIDILERLIAAISETEVESIKHSTYILSSSLSHITDSLTYIEQDGTPIQSDVTIEHHGKASTYEIDLVRNIDAEVIHSVDDDPEFMMQALDGFRTYSQNVDGERTQVASANDRLRVLEDFIAEKSEAVFAGAPQEESLLPEHDIDLSLTINIEDHDKDEA